MRFWKAYAIALGFVVLCGAAVTFPNQLFFRGSGTGAVNRQMGAKLADAVSVKDYGAVGDGVTDDSTAVTNALTASGTNQIIDFACPGTYKTTAYGTLACGDYYPPLAATGAVPRSVPTKLLGDLISVKDFGAKGDGVTNDATAIQNALNYNPTGGLQFPCGTYIVNSAISIADTFAGAAFVGANLACVTIKAGAAITGAMFQFADSSANGGFQFRDLTLDGAHLAQKGIASTQIRYASLERVTIVHTTVAAVDFSEGWDQNIYNCHFQNNDGDGIRLGTNANNVNLIGNVISTQPGWGITMTAGPGPVNILGNDISANAAGGIYVVRGSGTAGAGMVNIKNNYMEGNASRYVTGTLNSSTSITGVAAADVAVANANVGNAITGTNIPANTTISSASGSTIVISQAATASGTQTVYLQVGSVIGGSAIKVDVFLNGSTDATLLSNSFPAQNVNVEGNITTTYGAVHFVAWDSGTPQTVRIIGNGKAVYSTKTLILFGSFGVGGTPSTLMVEGNQGFTGFNGNTLHYHDRVIFPNATVTPDLGTAEEFVITPGTNAAITINAPINVAGNTNHPVFQYITFRVRDALGAGTALGAFTWNAIYHMAPWVPPPDGFERSITFAWENSISAWVEVSRTPFDVPDTGTPAGSALTLAGVTFATLPAAVNGTFQYCSDCTVATAPCTGAGTGAFAKRLNGTWNCQ